MKNSKFNRLLLLTVLCFVSLAGCGYSVDTNTNVPAKPTTTVSDATANTNKTTSYNNSNAKAYVDPSEIDPKAMDTDNQPSITTLPPENNPYAIKKSGLTILTTAPTDGPEKAAWDFYRLSGKQKYNDAVNLLTGYIKPDPSDKNAWKFYTEITGAKFNRCADVTDRIAKETEDNGMYDYRIVYIEVDLKLRGTILAKDTAFRNGLNHFAVHVVKKTKASTWQIVLLAGSPALEK